MSDLKITHVGTVQTQDRQGPMNPVAPLGQAGAIYEAGTHAIDAPSNVVFVAIQFVTDTVFDSSNTEGLVAEDNNKWPNSEKGANDWDNTGGNADTTNSDTFPAGMTIYGRWTKFKLASGSVIAYVG